MMLSLQSWRRPTLALNSGGGTYVLLDISKALLRIEADVDWVATDTRLFQD